MIGINLAMNNLLGRIFQRNVAKGSSAVDNTAYWPASSVSNGITASKVGSGTDTDGLPYVDVRFQGTSSGTAHLLCFTGTPSRVPAEIDSAWTCSFITRLTAGTTTGVSGMRAYVAEETAPSTYVGETRGNQVTAGTDTTTTATRTVATGNQVRPAVLLSMVNATAIDATFRVKGLQFERGSLRSAYQTNDG